MVEDTIEKVLFLLLGWALGLLAPVIVDAIKRKKEMAQTRIALLDELHEVKYRLALSAYFTETRFGVVDRTYLTWLRTVVSEYKGQKPKDSILSLIDTKLALPDEQLDLVAKSELAQPEGGLALKKYVVPLLDSRISSLWFFDGGFQRLLLEVRNELNLLNEEVDQARYYFGLTFTKLEGDNYARVNSNLTNCYRQMAERAKIAANKIGELEAYS